MAAGALCTVADVQSGRWEGVSSGDSPLTPLRWDSFHYFSDTYIQAPLLPRHSPMRFIDFHLHVRQNHSNPPSVIILSFYFFFWK